MWARYCHEVDDIVDGGRKGPEALLSTLALAAMVYSHPFYLRNLAALRQVALLVTNTYADSVAWANSAVPWQRAFADCYRHCGNEMVFAVAALCGGYDHLRSIAQEQRVMCYEVQHGREAKEA